MRRLFGAAVIAGALATSPLLAHHAGEAFQAGAVVVSHIWTHVNTPAAHANAVYLTVANNGTEADRLIAVEGDFFESAELQAPVVGEDGALRTTSLSSVEIAPGQSLTFQPGGVQIILVGLQESFFEGDHFHLSLVFEQAGSLEVEVEVEGHGHSEDHEASS